MFMKLFDTLGYIHVYGYSFQTSSLKPLGSSTQNMWSLLGKCVCVGGGGGKHLYKWSRSHDHNGHVHMWLKHLKFFGQLAHECRFNYDKILILESNRQFAPVIRESPIPDKEPIPSQLKRRAKLQNDLTNSNTLS